MNLEDLKMFLVRNSDGQYFCRHGQPKYESHWTDNLSEASVWTKQGTAKSRVTYFVSNYPEYPVPEIIEISAGEISVQNQVERVKKVLAARQKAKARHEIQQKQYMIEETQRKLLLAQKEMAFIQSNLDKMKCDS